jgi:RimJ/RimL family protein N-acetyltransferase
VFDPGTGVVTSRGDVHYVVTEYGIADLWGKNVRERALALTAIAHPHFRAGLLADAKERHYVFLDQSMPHEVYPGDEVLEITLKDGQKAVVRPIRITDERALQDLFYRLSSESTYQRFLHYKTSHPHEEMLRLVGSDFDSAHALVAASSGDETSTLIAMARYDVDQATQTADVAFVVDDAWQQKGLGTALLARLAKSAKERGLVAFTADALSSNKAMLGVFQASGLRYESVRDGNVTHVSLHF